MQATLQHSEDSGLMSDLSALYEQAASGHRAAFDAAVTKHEEAILDVAQRMAHCLQNGGKILSCGNGGSACDALHFAGELVGRFRKDRPALPAIALTADSGVLTAVGNDYGFEKVFSRQIEAFGQQEDLLIAISTSGSSENILQACEAARSKGVYTILLTGERGEGKSSADTVLAVPCAITAHIQEVHIYILQLLVLLCEKILYPEL